MNIYSRLEAQALRLNDKTAIIHPDKNESWTFGEFNQAIHSFCHQFKKLGIKPQDKVLLFVKPGVKFPALTFALFKMGAVPILIDPGMGRKNLINSIAQVKPDILIAEPVVFLLAKIYSKSFSSVRLKISVGNKLFAHQSVNDFNLKQDLTAETYQAKPDEMAALLFTSGGTGIPKGVIYTHKILSTQTQMLQDMFQLSESETDLPGFPLFALFTLAMGMTSCIPSMNPSKPAKCNPKKLVDNIQKHKPSFVAGSPAIWERVGAYCTQHKITLPSIKYMVMFGAPVSVKMHEMFKPILINGTTYTPYGATESLPVANISGREVLEKRAKGNREGRGTCVGKPVKGTEVLIYQDSEIPEPQFNSNKVKAPFQVGEILIQGDIATREYYGMPEQTKLHKIYDGENFWHRIGDLGYFDDEGNLWFCGRKSHQVKTAQGAMYPIPCEAIFNQHPLIKRTALIGLGESGKEVPAIVVERIDHFMSLTKDGQKKFEQELKDLARKYDHTKSIEKFFLYDHFPVDVRHNIKIDRLKLKKWAMEQKKI